MKNTSYNVGDKYAKKREKAPQEDRQGPGLYCRGGGDSGAGRGGHPQKELYALRHERHFEPGPAGDRRVKALTAKAPLYHVQDGAFDRGADEKRQYRGPDHEAESPRGRGHIRHHGTPFPGL